MDNIKAKTLLERAGFTTYNSSMSSERPYICFHHNGCNSYSGILYLDQPDNTILEIIFAECKKVGRIQVRQQLNHLVSNINYE